MITENDVLAKTESRYHEQLIQEAFFETQRLRNTVELIKKQIEVTEQLQQHLAKNMPLE